MNKYERAREEYRKQRAYKRTGRTLWDMIFGGYDIMDKRCFICRKKEKMFRSEIKYHVTFRKYVIHSDCKGLSDFMRTEEICSACYTKWDNKA